MYAHARPTATVLVNKGATAQLSYALHSLVDGSSAAYFRPCASYCLVQRPGPPSKRHFTTTPRTQIQERYFPPADTKNIKITPPAWHHPMYVSTICHWHYQVTLVSPTNAYIRLTPSQLHGTADECCTSSPPREKDLVRFLGDGHVEAVAMGYGHRHRL